MSEMASWFQMRAGDFSLAKGVAFLTDDDVIAWHEQHGIGRGDISWNNFVGHSGLMQVFNLPNRYTHHEGFVNMPDIIKKTILDGKMDKLFANAGNLDEATPEFIPMMRRLANLYPNVRYQLAHNPYKNYKGGPLTNLNQMKVGIRSKFKGSTIGELLRHPLCGEDSMLLALKECKDFMDEYSDCHHYHNMLDHDNVTPKVLRAIMQNGPYAEVRDKAKRLLAHYKPRTIGTEKEVKKALKNLKVKVVKRGKAKVRVLA